MNLEFAQPVEFAVRSMIDRLFKPFEIGLWFRLGFAAFLATIAESLQQMIQLPLQFAAEIGSGLFEDLPGWDQLAASGASAGLFAGLAVALIALFILMLYLQSRGRFVFIDSLARGTIQVGESWRSFAAAGASAFRFWLLLGLVWTLVLAIPLSVGIGAMVFSEQGGEIPHSAAIAILIVSIVFVLIAAIAFGFYTSAVTTLLEPIMYVQRISAFAAYRQAHALIRKNIGGFVLLGLVRFGLAIAASTVIYIAMFVTLCTLVCFLIIPYINSVVMLPVTVPLQLFTLKFAAQFGPGLDVFQASAGSGPAGAIAPDADRPPPIAGADAQNPYNPYR